MSAILNRFKFKETRKDYDEILKENTPEGYLARLVMRARMPTKNGPNNHMNHPDKNFSCIGIVEFGSSKIQYLNAEMSNGANTAQNHSEQRILKNYAKGKSRESFPQICRVICFTERGMCGTCRRDIQTMFPQAIIESYHVVDFKGKDTHEMNNKLAEQLPKAKRALQDNNSNNLYNHHIHNRTIINATSHLEQKNKMETDNQQSEGLSIGENKENKEANDLQSEESDNEEYEGDEETDDSQSEESDKEEHEPNKEADNQQPEGLNIGESKENKEANDLQSEEFDSDNESSPLKKPFFASAKEKKSNHNELLQNRSFITRILEYSKKFWEFLKKCAKYITEFRKKRTIQPESSDIETPSSDTGSSQTKEIQIQKLRQLNAAFGKSGDSYISSQEHNKEALTPELKHQKKKDKKHFTNGNVTQNQQKKNPNKLR